jgi:quercetin dioxygenase-like cupin family protein
MNIDIVETNNLKDFSLDGVRSTPLLDTGKVHALLLNLETGQAGLPCQMSVPVMYFVIEGQGRLRVGDEQAGLQTGSLVVVPAEAVRSIVADERMHVLVVQVL